MVKGNTVPGQIRGSVTGSMSAVKKSLKKKSGGGYLTRVPADDSLTVRFLTEPDEWVEFLEHYDDTNKFYPCVEGDCPGCDDKRTRSQRYLANALNVETGEVIPLCMPKSLAELVVKMHGKYSTLVDRNYELQREGKGKDDTSYAALPEAPTKIRVSRYEPIDLWARLEAQLISADEDDDDDEDEEDEPAPRRSARKMTAKPLRKPMRRS